MLKQFFRSQLGDLEQPTPTEQRIQQHQASNNQTENYQYCSVAPRAPHTSLSFYITNFSFTFSQFLFSILSKSTFPNFLHFLLGHAGTWLASALMSSLSFLLFFFSCACPYLNFSTVSKLSPTRLFFLIYTSFSFSTTLRGQRLTSADRFNPELL